MKPYNPKKFVLGMCKIAHNLTLNGSSKNWSSLCFLGTFSLQNDYLSKKPINNNFSLIYSEKSSGLDAYLEQSSIRDTRVRTSMTRKFLINLNLTIERISLQSYSFLQDVKLSKTSVCSTIVFCCYNCLDLPWEKFFQVWVTFSPSSWE